MHIGKKIKEQREKLGWTQRDLASKMGYASNSTVARIENGSVDVPQSRIVKFADTLGVSIEYLLDFAIEEEQEVCDMGDYCNKELMKRYLMLDDEDQIRISERINMMLEADKYRKKAKASKAAMG